MNYKFPIIENISDVLPAIEGCDDFQVTVKGDYTVIGYRLQSNTMFPPIYDEQGNYNLYAALRRECRGIIFCSHTGMILSRPFGKFFNYGEKTETLPENINIKDDNHTILNKCDGSMIRFFNLNNELISSTKAGITDTSEICDKFIENKPEYKHHAKYWLNRGFTAIYELCTKQNRIVLSYPEDTMILTAIRNMKTGEYISYDAMVESASDFNIPVVDSFNPINDITSFSDNVRDEQGIEGYVIRFHDGHMLKIKTDEYVAIHKAKESILWDRNIVELIIENKLDDIKAHLTRDEQNRLNIFENNIVSYIKEKEIEILNLGYDCSKSMTRKEFALNIAPKLDGLTKACVFSIYDWPIMYEVRKVVKKSILSNLTKNTNYDELCKLWFKNERYN